MASERWAEIDAAYYQTNLLRLSPSRFLNLVYAWCVERMDPEKLDEWNAELLELLPWQDSDSDAGADIESNSFMSMMNSNG